MKDKWTLENFIAAHQLLRLPPSHVSPEQIVMWGQTLATYTASLVLAYIVNDCLREISTAELQNELKCDNFSVVYFPETFVPQVVSTTSDLEYVLDELSSRDFIFMQKVKLDEAIEKELIWCDAARMREVYSDRLDQTVYVVAPNFVKLTST